MAMIWSLSFAVLQGFTRTPIALNCLQFLESTFFISHLSVLSTQLPLLESSFMLGPPGKHQASFKAQLWGHFSMSCFLVTLVSDPRGPNTWVPLLVSIWWDRCLFHLVFPVPNKILAQNRKIMWDEWTYCAPADKGTWVMVSALKELGIK